MHVRHLAIAMTIMACGGGGALAHDRADDRDAEVPITPDAGSDGEPGVVLDGPAVPYDRTIQKSVHNAYERQEPLLDQLVYHRIRSLELDIHVTREGVTAPNGEWFVYHEDNPFMRTTSCEQLTDCLGQLAAFHAAVPRHEVVTLFVDLKDGFVAGHDSATLDAAIAKVLGRSNVLAPADLVARCAGAKSLRDAVKGDCGFPTLAALRGKFILVTTGGTSCDPTSHVSLYGASEPLARLAFLGPSINAGCAVASYDARPDVVFLNMTLTERTQVADVRARGLVARIYGLNSEGDFSTARAAGAVHLATDKANSELDPWARTHLARGFPFGCDDCDPALVEPGPALSLRTTSGDQWDAEDSGAFGYVTTDASAETTWSALVSVPSSHVEPFAKACLVARASTDVGAANVAVCRPFDTSAPRVQIRATDGAMTTSVDAPTFDGLTAETPAFLRLSVKKSGTGSEAAASYSKDGKSWSVITTAKLASPLTVQGISVSGHGPNAVKGTFTNLQRTSGGAATNVNASMLEQKAIGTGATGDLFDGHFPP